MTLASDIGKTYSQFLICRGGRSWDSIDRNDPCINTLINDMRKPIMATLRSKIGEGFDESAADEKFFEVLSLPDGHLEPGSFLSYTIRAINNAHLDSKKRWPRYVPMVEEYETKRWEAPGASPTEQNEELTAAMKRLSQSFIQTLRTQNLQMVQTVLLRMAGKTNDEIAQELGDKTPAVQMRFSRFNDRVLKFYAVFDKRDHDPNDAEKYLQADLELIKEAGISMDEMLKRQGFNTAEFLEEVRGKRAL